MLVRFTFKNQKIDKQGQKSSQNIYMKESVSGCENNRLLLLRVLPYLQRETDPLNRLPQHSTSLPAPKDQQAWKPGPAFLSFQLRKTSHQLLFPGTIPQAPAFSSSESEATAHSVAQPENLQVIFDSLHSSHAIHRQMLLAQPLQYIPNLSPSHGTHFSHLHHCNGLWTYLCLPFWPPPPPTIHSHLS